ncbi:MAG: AMP-binding protein [Microthrixaceae bacterium]
MAELHLASAVEAIADAVGERPAIICGSKVVSWRELDERAARLASVLWDRGLRPHSKVGLYLHNSPEYLETWLAALKIRAVPVNINYRYVADELGYLVDNSDCEALVFSGDLAEHVHDVLVTRDLSCVLQVDGGDSGLIDQAMSWGEAVSGARPLDPMTRSEDDHYLLYTGGTTGLPKGVIYRMGGLTRELATLVGPFIGNFEPICSSEDIAAAASAANEAGTALTSLILPPLMHGTGMSLAQLTLLSGGTVVLVEGGGLDAAGALDIFEATEASVLAVVGDAFARPLVAELQNRVEQGRPVDLSALKLVMSSGAMLSAETKERLVELAPQALIVDTLAASEAPMGSSVTSAAGGPATTVFTLRPGTRVLDAVDADVEPGSGESGRVAVPTDNPIGYYKDPAKTAETFREIAGERYSLPGDWATVEADGTIRLLGRGSHCINSAGEKIFPEEVEEALKSHPAVMDALVVGVPDDRWGSRADAVVSLRSGHTAEAEELQRHLKEHLAAYKVPKNITIVDMVPRAPNGKADYRAAMKLVST